MGLVRTGAFPPGSVSRALQALSAAYLTRCGPCEADCAGPSAAACPQADLQQLRLQAPLLVAKAAAAEQLDWPGVLRQAKTGCLRSLAPGETVQALVKRQLPP